MYKDEVLTCKDCGSEFTFTASEQEFYEEKGFANKPGRCPQCRIARKNQNRTSGSRYNREDRPMFDAVCSACGKDTKVPFKPSGDKPVYCNDCFRSRAQNNW